MMCSVFARTHCDTLTSVRTNNKVLYVNVLMLAARTHITIHDTTRLLPDRNALATFRSEYAHVRSGHEILIHICDFNLSKSIEMIQWWKIGRAIREPTNENWKARTGIPLAKEKNVRIFKQAHTHTVALATAEYRFYGRQMFFCSVALGAFVLFKHTYPCQMPRMYHDVA